MEAETKIWHKPGMPEPDRWIYEKPSATHPRGVCYYHHSMEPFTTDAEYAYIDELIASHEGLVVAIQGLQDYLGPIPGQPWWSWKATQILVKIKETMKRNKNV